MEKKNLNNNENDNSKDKSEEIKDEKNLNLMRMKSYLVKKK